jgi:hypothetical protein
VRKNDKQEDKNKSKFLLSPHFHHSGIYQPLKVKFFTCFETERMEISNMLLKCISVPFSLRIANTHLFYRVGIMHFAALV